MLKHELKRLFHSRLLYLSIAVGFLSGIIGLFSFYSDIYYFHVTGVSEVVSCYEAWLYCLSLGSASIYRLIMPLLVALPFADSYVKDRASGYLNHILIRTSYGSYLHAKITALAVSAAAVTAAILLMWLLIAIILFPSALPNHELNYFPAGPFDSIYPDHPLIYIGILIMFNMLCGIIYSWIGLGFSSMSRNKFKIISVPFLFYLGQMLISQMLPFHWLFPVVMVSPYEMIGADMATLLFAFLFVAAIALILLYHLRNKDRKEYV